jgi:hypothetical protein
MEVYDTSKAVLVKKLEKSIPARFERAKYTLSKAKELRESYPDVSMALAFTGIETLELKGEKVHCWDNIKEFFDKVPEDLKKSFLDSQNKYLPEPKSFRSNFEEITEALYGEFRCNFVHDGFWHWRYPDNGSLIDVFYFKSRDKKRVRVCKSTIVEDFLSLVEGTMKTIGDKFAV